MPSRSSIRRVASLLFALLASCGGRELAPPAPRPPSTPRAVRPPPEEDRVAQLASGPGASCAVTEAGRLWCWGWLTQGASGVPVEVVGLEDVVEVALGREFRCARQRDSTVSCWGRGLGAGAAPNVLQDGFHRVGELEAVTQIAAGEGHACALAHGRVHCWGDQPGRRAWASLEVRREALPGPASKIAVGGEHSCALVNGEAWCWGPRAPKPRRVGAGALVDIAVSWTGDVCGVSAVGGLQCFGPRCSRRGSGWDDACDHAIDVGATRVVAGGPICVEVAGRWRCFGTNRAGEVDAAQDAPLDVSKPAPLAHAEQFGTIAEVSPGYDHVCVRNDAGALFCWGNDASGGLGRGPLPWLHRRYAFGRLETPAVALEDGTLCTIDDPAPRCWSGAVGLKGKFGDAQPGGLLIPAAAGCSLLAGRKEDACAARPGAVVCWGSAHDEPRTMPLDDVQALVMGEHFGCALAGSGPSLSCWGAALHLSAAAPNGASGLHEVVAANGASKVGAGAYHVCWSAADELWCVGDPSHGLGEANAEARRVGPVPGVEQIVGGRGFACVLARGEVRCLGDGSHGALGNGSWQAATSLQRVDLPPTVAIAAGNYHMCAAVEGGRVHCWGYNGGGELGTATRESTNRPARVLGVAGAHDVLVAAGMSCAREGDRLVCWGRSAAALVDAPMPYRSGPGPVLAFGTKPTVRVEAVERQPDKD